MSPYREDATGDPVEYASLGEFRAMTDLGNAERLVDRNGAVIRYPEDRQEWRAWVSPVWCRGDMGPVYRATGAMARSIRDEAAQLSTVPNENPTTGKPAPSDSTKMYAHAAASESRRSQESAIALAAHIPPVSCRASDFDRDPWLLNTPGAIVDLRSDGATTPNRPAAMLSRCTRAKAGTMAHAPRWDAFIAEITCGDAELSGYLQRAVGQTLIGTQREHVFFFCYGGGRNGKGVFLGTLTWILGDYGITLPPNLLIEKKNENHSTELTDLEGARLAVGSEVPRGAAWDEVKIKMLSGGDRIRAHKMRQDYYEFDASHTFWIAGNDKPRIRGMDTGIWRRMRLIPFLANVAPESEDRDLSAKLQAEADGILWWALEGCRMYLADGLGTCAAVETASTTYQVEEVFVGQFIEECCFVGEGYSVTKADFRAAMGAWMESQGYNIPNERILKSDLLKRKIVEGRADRTSPRGWMGVGLQRPVTQTSRGYYDKED